jgi:hypothetical protein
MLLALFLACAADPYADWTVRWRSDRPSTSLSIAVQGDRAWLGESDRISIDLSDPASPQILDFVDAGAHVWTADPFDASLVWATTVEDGVAYGIDAASNPPAVVHALSFDPIRDGQSPLLQVIPGEDVLYALDRYGLVVVARPDAPTVATATLLATAGNGGPYLSLAIHDGYAWLGDNFGVEVYDLDSLGAPVAVLSFADVVGPYDSPEANHLLFDGSTLYATAGVGWLAAVDASNPAAPSIRSSIGPLDGIGGFRIVDGETMYVAGSQAIHVVDVSDPDAITLVSEIRAATGLTDLEPLGDGLLVTAFHDSVALVGPGL